MTWFKIDDRMPDNTKVRKAGTAAMGLWALAGAWSAGNLTDGFVPKEIAKRWDSGGRLSKKLVTSGLWAAAELDDEPGYQFHQWDEWQPSKTDVLARRRAAADRVAKHRARTATENEGVSNTVGNALHDPLVTDSVTPPPSRPVPTRPIEEIRDTPTAPLVGSRKKPSVPIPDDWQPNESHRAKALGRGMDVDVLADEMRNWALSKDDRKANWDAAFTNWINRADVKPSNAVRRVIAGGLWEGD